LPYFFDTNVFRVLGHYYPETVPDLWNHLDRQAQAGELRSTREVKREAEHQCEDHVVEWVRRHPKVFPIPSIDEQRAVRSLFEDPANRGLVKQAKANKGLPVADPFLVAAASVAGGTVVTQESATIDGRIPSVCGRLSIRCINFRDYLREMSLHFTLAQGD